MKPPPRNWLASTSFEARYELNASESDDEDEYDEDEFE